MPYSTSIIKSRILFPKYGLPGVVRASKTDFFQMALNMLCYVTLYDLELCSESEGHFMTLQLYGAKRMFLHIC